jgi:anti-sigma factor RsiW
MTHLGEDDLVLHFYGEGDDRRTVEAHLESCAECRERFAALSRDMAAADLPVPERGPDYGAAVWARLQPHLGAVVAPRRRWWQIPMPILWPRLAFAGGIAVLVVAAFVAGRYWNRPAPAAPVTAEASPAVVRERILLVAVGEHLERSRVVLAEVSNRDTTNGADLSAEQMTAQDLVASGRLYRQAAVRSDPAIAAVLEELERTLVEIANGPSRLSAGELDGLRTRIESQGLLFKVTVLGSQVRQRQQDAAAAAPATARSKAST